RVNACGEQWRLHVLNVRFCPLPESTPPCRNYSGSKVPAGAEPDQPRIGTSQFSRLLRRTIAAHSPMSWAHVNMLGEYDFSDEKLKDSIGILPPKPAA
ncbi:MAG: hypothetical protein OXI87_05015, partial [Albidovulum sp.]|nr:hypothetical protein [Albidovulum sp.]